MVHTGKQSLNRKPKLVRFNSGGNCVGKIKITKDNKFSGNFTITFCFNFDFKPLVWYLFIVTWVGKINQTW